MKTQTAQNLHDMMVESTDAFHKITKTSMEKIEEIENNLVSTIIPKLPKQELQQDDDLDFLYIT